jgi:hypothetical protein
MQALWEVVRWVEYRRLSQVRVLAVRFKRPSGGVNSSGAAQAPYRAG